MIIACRYLELQIFTEVPEITSSNIAELIQRMTLDFQVMGNINEKKKLCYTIMGNNGIALNEQPCS